MSEALDRLRARRRAHRGVVTKYVQEVGSLLEAETIDDKQRLRLSTLSGLLKEKATDLKALREGGRGSGGYLFENCGNPS